MERAVIKSLSVSLAVSLAVAPMLVGCAGSLGPKTDPDLMATRQQSANISDLRAKLDRLNRRMRRLDRRVADVARTAPPRVGAPGNPALAGIKQRIEALEISLRQQAAATAGQPKSEQRQTSSQIADELAVINQKILRLAISQNATDTLQSKIRRDLDATGDKQARELSELTRKLTALEAVQKSAGKAAADPELLQRLAKAEKAMESFSANYDKMQKSLARDRMLVVDYLEDLDKRIEALEKSKPEPPAPTGNAASPAQPSPPDKAQ